MSRKIMSETNIFFKIPLNNHYITSTRTLLLLDGILTNNVANTPYLWEKMTV